MGKILITCCFFAITSGYAKASTDIVTTYDWVFKVIASGEEVQIHDSAGFTLYGQDVFIRNSSNQSFRAPLNQYVAFHKPDGTPINVKFLLRSNKIIKMDSHVGFISVQVVNIEGDSCRVRVKFQPLPGQKSMQQNGMAFRANDIHNLNCTIHETNWQPPQ